MCSHSDKIILDLCGGTGAWSEPYRRAGYSVKVVTLPDVDVRLFEYARNIYGVLAAPVCTDFAGSGARWWRGKPPPYEGLSIVDACLRIVAVTQPHFWVLENPVGRLRRWLGPPVMYFDPCDYGDPYTKRTCLWGKFNRPKLRRVKPTKGSAMWARYGGKSERTKRLRSVTPPGFARAFFEANR